MGRPSPLRVWVDSFGGVFKVAAALGVSSRAVHLWLTRKGYPRVPTILKIRELSKNKLSLIQIIASATPEKSGGSK